MEDGESMVLGGGRGWLGVFWRKFLSVMEVDLLKVDFRPVRGVIFNLG